MLSPSFLASVSSLLYNGPGRFSVKARFSVALFILVSPCRFLYDLGYLMDYLIFMELCPFLLIPTTIKDYINIKDLRL